MRHYYDEGSLFGKARLHPLFIIFWGLFLAITLISALDILLGRATGLVLGVSHEAYLMALTQKEIPSSYLDFFIFRLTVIQLLGFGLVGWLLAQSAGDWKREWFWETSFSYKKILWAGLIMLVAIPFYQIFIISDEQLQALAPNEWESVKKIEEQTQHILSQIMRSRLGLNIIIFSVVPAICEEIFFRGFLFQHFRRFTSVWVAILFSSLIFTLLHFQIYGFFARWVMGAMLSFLFFYGRSIHAAMFAHFVNNFFTTFVTWLVLNGYLPKELIDIHYQFDYSVVLLSCALTFFLAYWFFKHFRDGADRQKESY